MSVVTNIVAAFAITTTRMVPCPCPDGIQGCCVMHTKEVTETRYEPVRVDDHFEGNPCQTRGIALSTNAVAEAVVAAYFGVGIPQLIPVRPLRGDGVAYGGHPIGFLIGDAVKKECGLPNDWKEWRICGEW